MFGYLYVNKPELKIREFDEYHACYCGICRELKHHFGVRGQITVNYDAAFLTLLLTGLYEPECKTINKRCIASPLVKNTSFINTFSEYGAHMSMFLTYYKCIDDWKDDRKFFRYLYGKSLNSRVNNIRKTYAEKCLRIEKHMSELSCYEKCSCNDIDAVSGSFGHVMEELFDYTNDIWNKSLRKIGFYLGKFIYLMDAYEDIEDDLRSTNYNVFKDMFTGLNNKCSNMQDIYKQFETQCYDILSMMMAECSSEFERLPIISYAEILRNILYSGVWCRFREITDKRLNKFKEKK